jgi:hypothetical protein
MIGEPVLKPDNLLVDFGGKGKYSAPELSWKKPIRSN